MLVMIYTDDALSGLELADLVVQYQDHADRHALATLYRSRSQSVECNIDVNRLLSPMPKAQTHCAMLNLPKTPPFMVVSLYCWHALRYCSLQEDAGNSSMPTVIDVFDFAIEVSYP
jgi:hypothetical protein